MMDDNELTHITNLTTGKPFTYGELRALSAPTLSPQPRPEEPEEPGFGRKLASGLVQMPIAAVEGAGYTTSATLGLLSNVEGLVDWTYEQLSGTPLRESTYTERAKNFLARKTTELQEFRYEHFSQPDPDAGFLEKLTDPRAVLPAVGSFAGGLASAVAMGGPARGVAGLLLNVGKARAVGLAAQAMIFSAPGAEQVYEETLQRKLSEGSTLEEAQKAAFTNYYAYLGPSTVLSVPTLPGIYTIPKIATSLNKLPVRVRDVLTSRLVNAGFVTALNHLDSQIRHGLSREDIGEMSRESIRDIVYDLAFNFEPEVLVPSLLAGGLFSGKWDLDTNLKVDRHRAFVAATSGEMAGKIVAVEREGKLWKLMADVSTGYRVVEVTDLPFSLRSHIGDDSMRSLLSNADAVRVNVDGKNYTESVREVMGADGTLEGVSFGWPDLEGDILVYGEGSQPIGAIKPDGIRAIRVGLVRADQIDSAVKQLADALTQEGYGAVDASNRMVMSSEAFQKVVAKQTEEYDKALRGSIKWIDASTLKEEADRLRAAYNYSTEEVMMHYQRYADYEDVEKRVEARLEQIGASKIKVAGEEMLLEGPFRIVDIPEVGRVLQDGNGRRILLSTIESIDNTELARLAHFYMPSSKGDLTVGQEVVFRLSDASHRLRDSWKEDRESFERALRSAGVSEDEFFDWVGISMRQQTEGVWKHVDKLGLSGPYTNRMRMYRANVRKLMVALDSGNEEAIRRASKTIDTSIDRDIAGGALRARILPRSDEIIAVYRTSSEIVNRLKNRDFSGGYAERSLESIRRAGVYGSTDLVRVNDNNIILDPGADITGLSRVEDLTATAVGSSTLRDWAKAWKLDWLSDGELTRIIDVARRGESVTETFVKLPRFKEAVSKVDINADGSVDVVTRPDIAPAVASIIKDSVPRLNAAITDILHTPVEPTKPLDLFSRTKVDQQEIKNRYMDIGGRKRDHVQVATKQSVEDTIQAAAHAYHWSIKDPNGKKLGPRETAMLASRLIRVAAEAWAAAWNRDPNDFYPEVIRKISTQIGGGKPAKDVVGAVILDGERILKFFDGSDLGTVIHETGHLWRFGMPTDKTFEVLKWLHRNKLVDIDDPKLVNVLSGDRLNPQDEALVRHWWESGDPEKVRQAEETFADAFTEWIKNQDGRTFSGKHPYTASIKDIFKRLKSWFVTAGKVAEALTPYTFDARMSRVMVQMINDAKKVKWGGSAGEKYVPGSNLNWQHFRLPGDIKAIVSGEDLTPQQYRAVLESQRDIVRNNSELTSRKILELSERLKRAKNTGEFSFSREELAFVMAYFNEQAQGFAAMLSQAKTPREFAEVIKYYQKHAEYYNPLRHVMTAEAGRTLGMYKEFKNFFSAVSAVDGMYQLQKLVEGGFVSSHFVDEIQADLRAGNYLRAMQKIDAVTDKGGAEYLKSLGMEVPKTAGGAKRNLVRDLFLQFMYNNMLSSPDTQVINLSFTGLWTLAQIPMRALAIPIDAALYKMPHWKFIDNWVYGGHERQRAYYWSELLPYMSGISKGVKDWKDIMKHWIRERELPTYSESQAELTATKIFSSVHPNELGAVRRLGTRIRAGGSGKTRQVVGSILEKYISPIANISTNIMTASDLLFKSIAYNAELQAIAVREALKQNPNATKQQIKDFVARYNHSEEQMLSALNWARYNVFTDLPGEFVGTIQYMRERWPGVGKIALPFISTLANIQKRATELTPGIGLAMERMERHRMAAKPAARGGDMPHMVRGHTPADIIVKQAMGTIAAGMIVAALGPDRLTGPLPEDATEQRIWRILGRQPNSIRIGNRWVDYSRLEPIGPVLTAASTFRDWLSKEPDPNTEETNWTRTEEFAKVAGAMVQNFLDGGWFQNFEALTGSILRGEAQERMIRSLTSSVVPFSGFMRWIEQQFYKDKETGNYSPLEAENMVMRAVYGSAPAVARILADYSPQPDGSIFKEPVVNVFGEPIKVRHRDFWAQLLPVRMRLVDEDPVESYFEKAHWAPTVPSKKFVHNGMVFEFDDDILRMYTIGSGVESKEAIRRILQYPGFLQLPMLKQKKVIQDTMTKIRERHRKKAIALQFQRGFRPLKSHELDEEDAQSLIELLGG